MDKIKTEEYVRTIDGKFGIFDRYSSRKEDSIYKSPFNCFIKVQNRKTPLQCCRDYIVKHSKNIIDLIEVSDVIVLKNERKYEVISIMDGFNEGTMEVKLSNNKIIYRNHLEEVNSLVTKEQFNSIKYEIE